MPNSKEIKQKPSTKGAYPSPARLLAITAMAIFIAETGIMIIFYILPPLSPAIEIVIDALMVTVISAPVLYLFLYRPMVKHISDREKAEQIALRRTLYDQLTNLPNRILFEDRAQHITLVAKRKQTSYALILLEVHNLTEINNTLGHLNGDFVIQQVASRLEDGLRKSDTIARFGGNEFAILMPSVGLDLTILTAERILKLLETSIIIENTPISIEISIGIAINPDHGTEPSILMQHADVAMRTSKQERSGYSIYDSNKDPYSRHRLALFSGLREAVTNKDELTLHYQPKVDIAINRVSAAEALARWTHSEFGNVSPGEFIPLAEKTGLIKPLTRHVLDIAFQNLSEWKRNDININIAVNLSARNIQDSNLPDYLRELLNKWNVSPETIELEITESAIMEESQNVLNVLYRLNEMGFTLSIDDFGTGYSSLAYLSKLPIQVLKIDMSFVTDMVKDKNKATIVKSTIDLAHNLNLKVVAEGVEDQQTWDELKAIGCDIAQGFYISKPLPEGEFLSWHSQYPNTNQTR